MVKAGSASAPSLGRLRLQFDRLLPHHVAKKKILSPKFTSYKWLTNSPTTPPALAKAFVILITD
jgi:hypothetical protein